MRTSRAAKRVDPRARKLGFETQEPPPKAIAIGLVGVVGLALAALALAALALAGFHSRAPPSRANDLERTALAPPPPRLQVAPRADRAAIEAAAQAKLAGYGVSEADAGSAQIPIERAMQLQAERGWPDPGGRP